MKSIHIRSIGWLLLMLGALMIVPAAVAWHYRDYAAPGAGAEIPAFLVSIAVTIFAGILLLRVSRGTPHERITIADGFMAAVSSWIAVAAFSSLPFVFSGAIPNPVDAFFESMSGLTTTGASVVSDLDAMPRGIMFWRCMTQAIGGMGIIVLFVAILPAVGEGGHNLFRAEAPGGVNFEKVTPRVRETARALWIIYLGLITIETLALLAAGMPLYDAALHSFATISTGGFSTYSGSIADVDSLAVRWIFIIFMIMGGANFSLLFKALKGEGKAAYTGNVEFRVYMSVVAVSGLVLSATIFFGGFGNVSIVRAVTDGFFQVTTIITTTGYASADFALWSPFAQSLIFFLMFIGGCSGSTGGGIKVVRHIICAKTFAAEFRVMANPREVVAPKLQGKPLTEEAMRNTLVFMALYITLFVFGGLALTLLGSDMVTAFSASAACIGNVGPGLGEAGPMLNFGGFPAVSKVILIIEMLMGRLELFGVLVFFMAIVGGKPKV